MRAALQFAGSLREAGLLGSTRGVLVQLYGSLGATGRGHGSDRAVMLGLEGGEPERIDPDMIETRRARIRERGAMDMLGQYRIACGAAAAAKACCRVGSSCAGARPSCIDSCRRRPRRPCVTR